MLGETRLLRDARWLGFFALILSAWALMFAMSVPSGSLSYGPGWAAALTELCSFGARQTGFWSIYAMWALMAAAMMAPTFTPALKTYEDLRHAGAGSRSGFMMLVSGYLLVWLAYALAGSSAQWLLSGYGLLTPTGASSSMWLNSGLLLLAGSYQFSKLKNSCLNRCRSPIAFYFAHWRDGPVGAFHMGLRLGVVCAGCCWALMLLAFVGGTMNLIWMGVAMVLMTLEKLPQPGNYLTKPLGYTLIFGAALIAGCAIAFTL